MALCGISEHVLKMKNGVQAIAEHAGYNLISRVNECGYHRAATSSSMDASRRCPSFLGENAQRDIAFGARSAAHMIGAVCVAFPVLDFHIFS